MVTIEAKPAQGAFAAPPQVPGGPSTQPVQQGLQVTDRAVKRIASRWPRKVSRRTKVGCGWACLGGGCSGLSYSIKFDTRPRERDRIYDFDGVRVFVDPKSFLICTA